MLTVGSVLKSVGEIGQRTVVVGGDRVDGDDCQLTQGLCLRT